MNAGFGLSPLGNVPPPSSYLSLLRRYPVADRNYNIQTTDRIVSMVAMTAPRTFVLPFAAAYPVGVALTVVDEFGVCSTTNKLTIVPSGADKINGITSIQISCPYGYIALQSNGTSWTAIDTAIPTLPGLASAGIYSDNILAAGASGNDFSQNGSYIVMASSNFTAIGPNFDAMAVLALNHQTSSVTQFNSYICLYDNTAGAIAVNGQTSFLQLSSSTIALGSLPTVVGLSGLTAGHIYTMQLVAQRVQANGPTAWNIAGYGRNY